MDTEIQAFLVNKADYLTLEYATYLVEKVSDEQFDTITPFIEWVEGDYFSRNIPF